MPPKKKKKAKKEGVVDTEERYRRTLLEIEVLKDQLYVRREHAVRSETQSARWQTELQEKTKEFEAESETHRSVTADMLRQHRSVEEELLIHVYVCDKRIKTLEQRVAELLNELQAERDERQRVVAQKDAEIGALNERIGRLHVGYEAVLRESFEQLSVRIAEAEQTWQQLAGDIFNTSVKDIHSVLAPFR